MTPTIDNLNRPKHCDFHEMRPFPVPGSLMTRPDPIQCARLNAFGETISHGFFTREGGVSTGVYAGLNTGLGSKDDRQAVLENRDRVLHVLGGRQAYLATPHQVHSAEAIAINRAWRDGERPKADAVVTNQPGIALGILTADCGPVLFADAKANVIAAAHAGWKGAISGVLENTLGTMEKLGASRENVVATLGPSISRKNYEVGPEFQERLTALNPKNIEYFRPSEKDGYSMFDLPAYIMDRLQHAGVNARWTGHCTYDDEKKFFSYRRTTHFGEPDYGRQISTILIRG